jgi:hypothetical protein
MDDFLKTKRLALIENVKNAFMRAKTEDDMMAVLHAYYLTHPEIFNTPIAELKDKFKYTRYLGSGSMSHKRKILTGVLKETEFDYTKTDFVKLSDCLEEE